MPTQLATGRAAVVVATPSLGLVVRRGLQQVQPNMGLVVVAKDQVLVAISKFGTMGNNHE
jgi:hypothetical protein